MEHPLAEFDPDTSGKCLVLLTDCSDDTDVVNYIKK